MEMKIKNSNFICPRMQKIDIKKAFEFGKTSVNDFIYDVLIEEGWLKKINERYYKPTEKLLDYCFLPKIIKFNDNQLRFLAGNEEFNNSMLNNFFDPQIVKYLARQGFLLIIKNDRYKKSSKFEDFLADGEDKINTI